ncbi:RNA-binding protein [Nocardioides guangzhouensis]|uniref:RNA-binding protein n=1 Tax=Nocardioides guangzhouensis TaxID=2497878 RepID=A0A4Q4ZC97_9ACTN|nr:NYN domain-containing protein [Nocardioides guangzhouensis]RYP85660.1 RNA-binding protein [Nocardioides guangzhouensis]
MSGARDEEVAGRELPGPVRTRALSLAADALPLLGELPAPLRKVAGFAPQRRARLGGSQIAAALETDDDFRRRVADQVAAAEPALATALAEGVVPAAADPVEVAALAWLARPEGWETAFDDAVRRVSEAAAPRDAAELERARARVEVAERALRDARQDHKTQLEELKSENTTLRRKLGEERAARRTAGDSLSDELVAEQEARQKAETALAAAEADVRRLRGQVEELRAAAASVRREQRSDRDDATLRTRMLLDTLIEAGQGLRRELGLPATPGTPADRIEAAISEAAGSPGAAKPGPADAVLLERYLGMPRARLIVDGYNVSKTAWPDATLETQRTRLLTALAQLVSRTGAETTVVFDAASSLTRPPVAPPRGVKVLFSPQGVIADDVIRELVAVEPAGRVVVVVTSDAEVVRDVGKAGARPISSSALLTVLGT